MWGAEVDHLGLAGWRSPPPYRCSGPRWRRLGNTSKAGRTGGRWQPHHPHQTASRGLHIKMLQQSCSSIKPISMPLYEACRTTEEVLAGLGGTFVRPSLAPQYNTVLPAAGTLFPGRSVQPCRCQAPGNRRHARFCHYLAVLPLCTNAGGCVQQLPLGCGQPGCRTASWAGRR